MLKSVSTALIATVCLAEQTFEVADWYHYNDHVADFPPVTTPMTFE